jgi:hypothetical protein
MSVPLGTVDGMTNFFDGLPWREHDKLDDPEFDCSRLSH